MTPTPTGRAAAATTAAAAVGIPSEMFGDVPQATRRRCDTHVDGVHLKTKVTYSVGSRGREHGILPWLSLAAWCVVYRSTSHQSDLEYLFPSIFFLSPLMDLD